MCTPRNSDQVLDGFAPLATAAGLAEVSETVNNLKDTCSDLIVSTTRMGNNISFVSSLSTKLDECTGGLGRVASQLDSQKAIIVDALKVLINFRFSTLE